MIVHFHWRKSLVALIPLAFLAAFSGCGKEDPEVLAQRQKFMLASKPDAPQGVVQVREAFKENKLAAKDEVTLVGTIGGVDDPWSSGYASFVIIDSEVAAHAHEEDDGCPHCKAKREKQALALVQLVDEKGEIVRIDAQKLLKVKKDQEVIVRGRIKTDEEGNFVVEATGVFVGA
jgi:hypothetical protein